MVGSIRLTKSQSSDLQIVCRVGPEKLAKLRKDLDSEIVKPGHLLREIIESLGDKVQGEALERVLFGFSGARRRQYGSIKDLTEAVSKYVANEPWEAELVKQWAQVKPEVEALLAQHSIVLAAKARDLGYDYERVYHTSRIITDIRPIFDDGRARILGATITQSLRLETYTTEGQQSISIALDAADINDLRLACERAIAKAQAARELMTSKCEVEVMILGRTMSIAESFAPPKLRAYGGDAEEEIPRGPHMIMPLGTDAEEKRLHLLVRKAQRQHLAFREAALVEVTEEWPKLRRSARVAENEIEKSSEPSEQELLDYASTLFAFGVYLGLAFFFLALAGWALTASKFLYLVPCLLASVVAGVLSASRFYRHNIAYTHLSASPKRI